MKWGTWTFIITILAIMGFEIYGLKTMHQLANDYKQEAADKDKQIVRLNQQRKAEQIIYQDEIEKIRETARKVDIIYGYIVGYLAATNKQLIADEIPEFAVLTVQYANESGVSPYDCLTICQIENGFNLHKPGKAGERGPAQLMKGTWELYRKKFNYQPADFYDWKANYRVAVAHFSELLKQNNNDVAAAIGEYNGGGRWNRIASARNHVKKFEVASRGILRLKREGL